MLGPSDVTRLQCPKCFAMGPKQLCVEVRGAETRVRQAYLDIIDRQGPLSLPLEASWGVIRGNLRSMGSTWLEAIATRSKDATRGSWPYY